VVDAAILVSAARGKSSAAIRGVAGALRLVTTDRAVEEARRRIEFGMKRPELLPVLGSVTSAMPIVPAGTLAPFLEGGELALRDAVPSRNGSVKDAHVLALAWSQDADVWSPDRDFAGTGVASWSTPNLLRALARAGRLTPPS
jgi:predicted nucleic acid-binding protein